MGQKLCHHETNHFPGDNPDGCRLSSLLQKSSNGGSSNNGDRLKDSTILYARDIYLWYDKIPSSFNARNYEDPNDIMEAIRQYSIEPGFTGPVDRWSFAVTKNVWDDLSQRYQQ